MAKGRVDQNNDYIEAQLKKGKEHIMKNQLPYPGSAARCNNVLAVNNQIVYFKSSAISSLQGG